MTIKINYSLDFPIPWEKKNNSLLCWSWIVIMDHKLNTFRN